MAENVNRMGMEQMGGEEAHPAGDRRGALQGGKRLSKYTFTVIFTGRTNDNVRYLKQPFLDIFR